MRKIYIDNFVQFGHLAEDDEVIKNVGSPEYYPCILILYQTIGIYCYRREFTEHEFKELDNYNDDI